MVTEPLKNHDILGLVRRINRFVREVSEAQSAGVTAVRAADLERWKSYQGSLAVYKAWIVDQPELDLPETHPENYTTPPSPEIPPIENESALDIITMWGKQRDELLASNSSQMATGLISHDAARFDAMHAKIDAFIKDYVEVTLPLDLPESTPSAPAP